MKKYLVLIIALALSNLIIAQNDNSWDFGFIFGYQNGLNRIETPYYTIVGENDPKVHQFGISLNKLLFKHKKFEIELGTIISLERIAGEIVVNNFNFSLDRTKFGYTVGLIEIPLRLNYILFDKLNFNLSFSPQIRIYQNETILKDESNFVLEPNGIENYFGIGYKFNRLKINIDYRWMNFRAMDGILYYRYDLVGPLEEIGYSSFYNPLKFRIKFGLCIFE